MRKPSFVSVLSPQRVFILCVVYFSLVSAITVEIDQGKLAGRNLLSVSGNTDYYSFKGIPYAEPPVGELRFKPPKPHSGWKNGRKALEHGNICPQTDSLYDDGNKGNEDCLFLNVYTPNLKRTKRALIPVMFWVHGGFFRYGSGNTSFFGPDYFMDEDVVLVTINYRLGPLGFLDLEDSVVPGNMGLQDIVLALQWVQHNIAKFGGDPSKVTVFGNGSGGVAIDILVLSPIAKGLFTKAICQSGVSLMSPYLGWSPKHRAMELALLLGISSKDSAGLLKDFKKQDAISLMEFLSKTIGVDETNLKQIGIIPFSPSINQNHNGVFMQELPEDIFAKGKLPNPDISLMIGFNSQESILHSKFFIQNPQFLKQMERHFQFLFPLRGIWAKYDSNAYYEVAHRLRHFYFINGTIDITRDNVVEEYLNFMSDLHVVPIDKTVKSYAALNNAPVYYYRFSYEGDLNYYRLRSTEELYEDFPVVVDGASERDEICYLFKCDVMKSKYVDGHADDEEQADLVTVQQMVRLWTNFAKTGNPTPEKDELLDNVTWEPVTPEKANFLDIGDQLTLALNPHFKSTDFWEAMYKHYLPMAVNGVLSEVKDEL